MEKKSSEVKKKQSRTAEEEEYERMVAVENTNREDSVIEARSVEEAVAKMTVAESLPADCHPERRLKASFKGFVISDWEALDRLCEPQGSDYRFCISSAINAGIDMVMVPFRYEQFVEELVYLVEHGKVSVSRIDDAVERILRVKFVAGLFEHPFSDRSLLDIVGCKLHRDLAREAVRKSLVLLKNGKAPKKPFLPLDRKAKRILVTGTHAEWSCS